VNKGVLTVVFGKEFDRLAAATFSYGRKFTKLPFHVLTNLKEESRSAEWKKIKNVTFEVFDLPQSRNRQAKLSMNAHTPFDQTLYLDCDSVIQKEGVETFADYFGDKDLVLCHKTTFLPERPVYQIYADTMKVAGVGLPLILYYGAIIAFKKDSKEVDRFFASWYGMWEKMGSGREMPSLCSIVKRDGIKRNLFPRPWFSGMKERPGAIVQHHFGKRFCSKFKVPEWEDYKPYDKPENFRRVFFQ